MLQKIISARNIVFILILSGLTGCINKDAKVEALTVPEAPFAKSAEVGKAIKVKGQIEKRDIVFGSKKLIVNPNGMMKLISEGRELCKIFFYVKTDRNAYLVNSKTRSVPCKWSRKAMGISDSTYDPAKKQFVIKGNFPLDRPETGNPAEGRFTQTVTLLNDGTVKIENQFDIPEQNRSSLKKTAMFLQCADLENYSADGKDYSFESKMRHFNSPITLDVAKNNNAKSFNIKILSAGRISTFRKKNIDDLRIYPKGKDYKVSFILDPGKVTVKDNNPEADTNAFAGVNFKQADDLEIPSYTFCRNLLPNPSFERGVMFYIATNSKDDFRGTDAIRPDTEDVLFGKYSLKAELYGTGYAVLPAPVPAEPGAYVFSFYAKAVGDDNARIVCHIKTPTSSCYKKKIFSIKTDWQRYILPVNVNSLTALTCRLTLLAKDKSYILLDGLQIEKGKKATAFVAPAIEGMLVTAKDDNFFEQNEPIGAALRIYSTKPAIEGRVRITVKDFFSIQQFEDEYAFKADQGGIAEIKLPFDNKFDKGIYVVKAAYSLANGQQKQEFFRFSIMDFLKNKHKLKAMFANAYHGNQKRDVYPGLETYLKRLRNIGIGGDTHSGPVTEYFDKLLKKYGIEEINACMSGVLYKDGSSQKAKDNRGRYYFGIYSDTGWRKGAKCYIKDFRQDGDGKLTNEYLKRFEKAVIENVKDHPWIPRWAFSGESNAKWPEWLQNDLESFVRIQIAFYHAVKKANPETAVFNGAPCNIYPEGGVKVLKRMLKQINGRIKYDALAIHTYLPNPYSLDSYVENFLKMGEEFGYIDTPTFYPEGMHYGPYKIAPWDIASGWGLGRKWHQGTLSYDMGWMEKLSSAWFARSWLVFMKHMDRVISATSAAENMDGTFHLDARLTPRAYQKIPNTLGSLLGNSRFVEDVSFAPETKCLIFEDEKKRPVAAVWSKIHKVDRGLEDCPWAEAELDQDSEILDLMEVKRKLNVNSAGKVCFPLSPFPFFIRGKAGTTKQFCDALRNSQTIGGSLVPLKMTAKVADKDTLSLLVSNQIARDVKATITASGNSKNIDVQPGKTEVLNIKMPVALSADKIAKVDIPVSIAERGNARKLSRNVNFEGFLCQKTQHEIKIDGSDNDWAGIPYIPLKNRTKGKADGASYGQKGDLEATFKTAWNKDYLYLIVNVKDNKFIHEEYSKTMKRWNNDSLQIFIDTKCDAREKKQKGYDTNDYDYAVFPNSNGDGAVVYRYKTPDIQLTLGPEAPEDHTIAKHIPCAFKKTNDGYIYEVAFPSKYLLPVRLENNYVLGFSISVHDRDNVKTNRKYNTKQALNLTPPGQGGYRKPYLYPVMLLTNEECKMQNAE